MTKLLVASAALGFAMSTAGACEYMRSAKAGVDQTVGASVAGEENQNMSTKDQQLLLLPVEMAAPAEQEDE